MPWLINATQLDKFRKSQKNVLIFDACVHHDGRDALQEFAERHIIGAQYFPIDRFNDHSPDAPHAHMVMRDEATISEKLSELGIRNDCKIIFYDNSTLHTACRALWMMKLFGHNPQHLYILDGGLHAWDSFGGKIESGLPTITPKTYRASYQPQFIRTLAQMKTNLQQPIAQVLDSRHAVRFSGGPEPRPHLRSGHIPGSFCFPSITAFDANG